MRILFFIENLLSGGKERRLVELMKGLRQKEDIEFELCLMRREVHYKEIFKLDIKIHILTRRFTKKDPTIFWKFYTICKSYKPDIIHVWGSMCAFYSIPTKLILKIPQINNQIADAPTKLKKGLISSSIPFAFADLIIANSKAGLKAYNISDKIKSKVIYNGFNFNRLEGLKDKEEVRNLLGIKTKYVISMIATFYPKKDYTTYLNTAVRIIEHRNDVTFLCIGAGEFSTYEDLIPTKDRSNILFLGIRDDVESIINICDIGVLTTYGEGISNALMEFMALKKPVITTKVGGTVELVEHFRTGYLIGVENSLELENYINVLLNDGELAIKMGQAGHNLLKEKFSITQFIDEFYKSYKILIY